LSFAKIESALFAEPLQTRPMPSALGYRTPEEFVKATSGGCGKDGGQAALENASRFPLSHSLDGCGHPPVSVMLESLKPKNLSLPLN